VNRILKTVLPKLLAYCRQNNWAGFDPFDGLNSRMFSAIPILQNRLCRLVFIQGMKRSPINFRPLFLVPRGENPKGIAVFCSSLLILSKMGLIDDDAIVRLLKRLIELRSPGTPYHCWGYNFDWQSREFFLPKFVPNIICTTFAGNALLDAHEKFPGNGYLDMAVSAGDFILNGLNITKTNGGICFSYTPLDREQVHNANLLGAAYLSRLYSLTKENRFLEPAEKAVRFSILKQAEDGSWPYGEEKTQQWVDGFHTGYNLGALRKFSEYTGNTGLQENIKRGFKFYKDHFFTPEGIPKYYHNKLYPVDIHAVAQSLITLSTFSDLDENNMRTAESVLNWAVANMWDDRGYFYYQVTPYYKNRIPYMRWSQAWMLLALVTLKKQTDSQHCV
jgi:hypothetical protein